MDNLFSDVVSDSIVGLRKANKPDNICFINTDRALCMLHRHAVNGDYILVHCDVDCDGIGSGYIFKKNMHACGTINMRFVINKDKVHGISEKYVKFVNGHNVKLLVVLDSGSSDIEEIKKMKCDVLVIDHHEVDCSIENMCGSTDGGEYVVLNNTVHNDNADITNKYINEEMHGEYSKLCNYSADDRMSCGLVLYEFIRIYNTVYGKAGLEETLMLYQWAGLTLFTDAVQLSCERNQWYIENTVDSKDLEPTIAILMSKLSVYNIFCDKSFINYKLAPEINRAIRAGESIGAMQTVLSNPFEVCSLDKYKDIQDRILSDFNSDVKVYNDYVLRDVSDTGISGNYCGVIASKLCEYYDKNAMVYTVRDDMCYGHFRGRTRLDYRSYLNELSGVTCQGHKSAFGIKMQSSCIESTMSNLSGFDNNYKEDVYLSFGSNVSGKHVIKNGLEMERFISSGGLYELANANSRLASDEEIYIAANREALVEDGQSLSGKAFYYNVFGVRCVAMEPIISDVVLIYFEYSSEIKGYIRNSNSVK